MAQPERILHGLSASPAGFVSSALLDPVWLHVEEAQKGSVVMVASACLLPFTMSFVSGCLSTPGR